MDDDRIMKMIETISLKINRVCAQCTDTLSSVYIAVEVNTTFLLNKRTWKITEDSKLAAARLNLILTA